MAIKDFLDFSLFTDAAAAFDLYSNSIRKGFSYDAYGDKRRFRAVVLNDPIPLRASDVKYFNPEGEPKFIKKIREALEKADPGDIRLSKFIFKARIIGPNSPHLFLPDPCDPTYAEKPEEAQKLIALHTTFVSNEDMALQVGMDLPRRGSIVEVLLNKNVFGYDLQKGTFLNVVNNGKVSEAEENEAANCEKLIDIFDDAEEFEPNLSQMSTTEPKPWDGKFPVGTTVDIGKERSYPISGTPTAYQIAGAHIPTKTYITSEYGAQRTAKRHGGIDFQGGKRTFVWHDPELRGQDKQPALKEESQEPVYSIFDGEVIRAEIKYNSSTGYGGVVEIKHNEKDMDGNDREIVSYYGHIEYTPLKKGDIVRKGQWIANIGSQGSSTGPHLHLQIDVHPASPAGPDKNDTSAVNAMDLFAWEIEKRTHELRSS